MSGHLSQDISVIVDVFCPTQDLYRALDSVFTQTLPPAEVLVIDDGSPQEYDHFFSGLTKRYPQQKLRLTRLESNQGLASSRNFGVNLATAPLVCFLDQDDFWPQDKLEYQHKALFDNPKLDAIAGTQVFLKDVSITEKPKWMGNREFDTPYPGYILGALMIKKDALSRVGPFDPALQAGTDDVDWFFRAKSIGLVIQFDSRPALLKRIHANNTSRYAKQHNLELLKVVRRHLPQGDSQ